MISIRAATAQDASAIAHVHVESWKTTYAGIVPDEYLAGLDEILRTKLWHELLATESLVLVAELGGRMVGFAHGGTNREPLKECDAELYSIYLLHEAQRHGTGTALLRGIATGLADRGLTRMAVWVLEKNPSRNFYERMGAHLAASKVIDIGGMKLMEVAYVWAELRKLVPKSEADTTPQPR